MDEDFWKLSKLDYSDLGEQGLSETNTDTLKDKKYLERPLAYEFYHQLRLLIKNDEVDFGGPIVQAEVDKTYQHCFENGKVPDFIIHIPGERGSKVNLAVIEFKRASLGLGEVEKDLKKLSKFRKKHLKYQNLVEVLIGEKDELEKLRIELEEMSCEKVEEICILEFDVESEKVIN